MATENKIDAETKYAGYGGLFGAFIIDLIIFIFGSAGNILTLILLGNLGYYFGFGKTSGYNALSLKVVDEKTLEKASFLQLLVRFLVSIRGVIILIILYFYYIKTALIDTNAVPDNTNILVIRVFMGLGALLLASTLYMFFNKKRQTFGEKISKTVTIKYSKEKEKEQKKKEKK